MSPKPKAGEISIRNKAVALHPVEWKKDQFGIVVDSWPAVFGTDVAGVVESVGEGVDAFNSVTKPSVPAYISQCNSMYQSCFSRNR